ncbi:hypothetical protein EOE67_13315 [Rheinheimera riviphila]|uniref:Nuclear transport factor 2 family protein n=1 Tax=Rheinheimera riviphila TaxID=1834037 RepID=A0A437QM21_9GAMM|nr:hypothetical protein [Rheinheimera riviphila]RVU35568.1 hypothetical protein EOE67_13315 [Rheinheimera riviphila]
MQKLFLLILPLLTLPLSCVAAEKSAEETVATLWNAISNDAGATADTATLQRIFHQDAVIFGGRYQDGKPVVQRSMLDDFLKPLARVQEKGFYECEISRVVQTYDRFAVAYSVVESRTEKTATKPDFVGVNSVQLYKQGDSWQILSLYYHVEKPDLPIAAPNAVSGRCLNH